MSENCFVKQISRRAIPTDDKTTRSLLQLASNGLVVSLLAWGLLTLTGVYWRPLRNSPEAACLFAMSIGCMANWLKNRSFHCAIKGPLFLVGGVVLFLSGMQVIRVNVTSVWTVVFVGTAIAFLLEWRFASRSKS